MTESRKSAKGSPQNKVQSLSRAFNLLMRLSDDDSGVTLSELANAEGLAPSTAHRLLNSMRQLGFTDYDDSQGCWSVGVNAFRVGNAYLKKRDYIAQARSVMKRLVSETGETSNLGVLQDDQVVFVSQIECQAVMRMVVQVGSQGPVHASGVGKALLSALPMKEALRVLKQGGMPRLTDRTLTSEERFSSELRQIRVRGYALDDEEQTEGLRCIAANIYDEFGMSVAAVSISGPAIRVNDERIPQLSHSVMAAAEEITRLIGGCRPEGQ